MQQINFPRIFHTVRHLKPIQIFGRPFFWLKRKLSAPHGADYEARAAHELKRLYPLKSRHNFNLAFLNQTCEFSPDEMHWKSSDWSQDIRPEKLWLYHLNYFSWLFDPKQQIDKELQLFLILDWIESNPSAHSETWEPYPASKRIRNWIKWLEEFRELAIPLRDCIESSIFSQTIRLSIDIEYHNQANHLFENLTCLLISSIFLLKCECPTPIKISDLAKEVSSRLIEQIAEQFFNDGGHYERSPMYHIEMLEAVENINDCCRNHLNEAFIEAFPGLKELLQRLKEICTLKIPLFKDWLANLTHPDGHIALFNDSALKPGKKSIQTNQEKPLSYPLQESGFYVRRWQKNYFVLSCGEPSPAYQPGHSHCDIMSYELSLEGRRCIIDTGCGSYQNPEIRKHCRRTSSHNVPLIELAEQSDIWGFFRIGKRAKIIERHFDSQAGILVVEMLDQYEQKFRREVVFGQSSIKIRDRMYQRRITGTFCSIIHLHPDCQIFPENDSSTISLSCGEVRFRLFTTAKLRTEPHLCYPDFGLEQKSVKLILSNYQTEAIDYVISW